MHRHLIACAIIGSAFLANSATGFAAEDTRVQHLEWMRKFGNPGGSMNGLIAAQDSKVYRIDLQLCHTDNEKEEFDAANAC
jgi:hypothetical protein